MNYTEKGTTLLEIPDEISLFYSISGCPLRCRGCHSRYLRNHKNGDPLTEEIILNDIQKYKSYITNVLFMGGEWEPDTLISLLKLVKDIGLKTSLYTGLDDVPCDIKQHLDYLKVGPYVDTLGGLSSKTTNQKLINLNTNEILNHKFQSEL